MEHNYDNMASSLAAAALGVVLDHKYPGVGADRHNKNLDTLNAVRRRLNEMLRALFPPVPADSLEFYSMFTPGPPDVSFMVGYPRTQILVIYRSGSGLLAEVINQLTTTTPQRSTIVCHYVLPPLE